MVEEGGLTEKLFSVKNGVDLRKYVQAPIEAGTKRERIEARACADRMPLCSLLALR